MRYDPFSGDRNKVLIYSLDDRFLLTAKRYARDILDDFQPQPLPKPKYNYIDMIVEQHDQAIDAQAKGIDFTQLPDHRWPFPSFVQTLARLLGEKGGLGAFGAEQLEFLKTTFDAMPGLSEPQLIAAFERAEVKNLHHVLWQLQQQEIT